MNMLQSSSIKVLELILEFLYFPSFGFWYICLCESLGIILDIEELETLILRDLWFVRDFHLLCLQLRKI